MNENNQCYYGDQTDSKGNNWTNKYPPMKGYLRETCKSQNINPIYLNLKFTFRYHSDHNTRL